MKYLSTRGEAPAARLRRDPARRAGSRRRPLRAGALPARRCRRRSRAGATLPYPALAVAVLSLFIDDIPAGRPARARRAELPRRRRSATRASRRSGHSSPASSSSVSRTGRHSRSRTWRCSSSATCSSTSSRGAAHAQRARRDLGRHRQRGRARAARQARHPGLHAVAAGPHEPVPAGADVQPAGREHPQHRGRRRVRRLPGPRQGGLRRSRLQGARTRSARSTRSTGRASLAQVVYYFAGYFQATRVATTQRGRFAVPSGNFGNICAGHVARMMGLPIRRLVLATNENDVLDEFFRTGTYRVRAAAETHETSSPSMDISKASNFERFVFDLLGRDPARVRDAVRRRRRQRGELRRCAADEFARDRRDSVSSPAAARHADRLATIARCAASYGEMIDTHTADGAQGRARTRRAAACR